MYLLSCNFLHFFFRSCAIYISWIVSIWYRRNSKLWFVVSIFWSLIFNWIYKFNVFQIYKKKTFSLILDEADSGDDHSGRSRSNSPEPHHHHHQWHHHQHHHHHQEERPLALNLVSFSFDFSSHNLHWFSLVLWLWYPRFMGGQFNNLVSTNANTIFIYFFVRLPFIFHATLFWWVHFITTLKKGSLKKNQHLHFNSSIELWRGNF